MEIFQKALKGILNSKKAGADFVKFQFIKPEKFVTKKLKSLVRGKEKYQIQRLKKKFVSHLIKLKNFICFLGKLILDLGFLFSIQNLLKNWKNIQIFLKSLLVILIFIQC